MTSKASTVTSSKTSSRVRPSRNSPGLWDWFEAISKIYTIKIKVISLKIVWESCEIKKHWNSPPSHHTTQPSAAWRGWPKVLEGMAHAGVQVPRTPPHRRDLRLWSNSHTSCLDWALRPPTWPHFSKLKKIWWVQRYFLCEYNVKHLCQVLCQVFCWNVENLLACKLHVVLSFHSFLLSHQCGLFRLDECCCLSIKQQSSPTWAENPHNDDSTRKSLAAEARRCCNWKKVHVQGPWGLYDTMMYYT